MAFDLLPPPKDVCQECGVKHRPEEPHNATSLFYQYQFRAYHGRWPTWKDAISQCSPDARSNIEAFLRQKGEWTEPESEVPDHVPDGKIGTVKVFPADDEGRSSNP